MEVGKNQVWITNGKQKKGNNRGQCDKGLAQHVDRMGVL